MVGFPKSAQAILWRGRSTPTLTPMSPAFIHRSIVFQLKKQRFPDYFVPESPFIFVPTSPSRSPGRVGFTLQVHIFTVSAQVPCEGSLSNLLIALRLQPLRFSSLISFLHQLGINTDRSCSHSCTCQCE